MFGGVGVAVSAGTAATGVAVAAVWGPTVEVGVFVGIHGRGVGLSPSIPHPETKDTSSTISIHRANVLLEVDLICTPFAVKLPGNTVLVSLAVGGGSQICR